MAAPLKQVSQFAEYGLLIWLAVLLAVLAYRGLASGKLRELVAAPLGDGAVSPARLQALGVTVGFAGYYLTLGLRAVSEGATRLPDVHPETLSIVAASLGLHMGGKFYERQPGRGAPPGGAGKTKRKTSGSRKSSNTPKT